MHFIEINFRAIGQRPGNGLAAIGQRSGSGRAAIGQRPGSDRAAAYIILIRLPGAAAAGT